MLPVWAPLISSKPCGRGPTVLIPLYSVGGDKLVARCTIDSLDARRRGWLSGVFAWDGMVEEGRLGCRLEPWEVCTQYY